MCVSPDFLTLTLCRCAAYFAGFPAQDLPHTHVLVLLISFYFSISSRHDVVSLWGTGVNGCGSVSKAECEHCTTATCWMGTISKKFILSGSFQFELHCLWKEHRECVTAYVCTCVHGGWRQKVESVCLCYSLLMYYYWAVGQGYKRMDEILQEQLKLVRIACVCVCVCACVHACLPACVRERERSVVRESVCACVCVCLCVCWHAWV